MNPQINGGPTVYLGHYSLQQMEKVTSQQVTTKNHHKSKCRIAEPVPADTHGAQGTLWERGGKTVRAGVGGGGQGVCCETASSRNVRSYTIRSYSHDCLHLS